MPRRVVARHGAALARRHVVRGVERVRRRGAERADLAAADARAERVAAVLDQHEVVLAAQRLHARAVERVAERVGEHEPARARADRGGDRLERRVVGVGLDVDVDRHEPVLVDGRDRGGEADRGADHLVARAERALVQVRGRRPRRRAGWPGSRSRPARRGARSTAAAKPARNASAKRPSVKSASSTASAADTRSSASSTFAATATRERAGRERLGRERGLGVAADGVERRPHAARRGPPARR